MPGVIISGVSAACILSALRTPKICCAESWNQSREPWTFQIATVRTARPSTDTRVLGAAGTTPRRSDDERLTLLDPQKPERTAAVVVGTAIARSRKSQKLLEALLGLVAGCPSRCALKLDRSGLEEAFAEAPSRAGDLEIELDGGRDLRSE